MSEPEMYDLVIIGGGPAGLACADILNKKGHTTVVYEADEKVGGYLRYGIPDFKMAKSIIDRRLDQLEDAVVDVENRHVASETSGE